ncbi:MAG: hemagglutinin repeat-containing protein [Methylacidiphilales bacterium]|nr:hemagglutinin repeat-containing protein [Candidatus Methylacidiphilales bacterium]
MKFTFKIHNRKINLEKKGQNNMIASTRPRRTVGFTLASYLFISLLLLLDLPAQVVPDSSAPAHLQPSINHVGSIPVVAITAPSTGGISWNQYTQFNVGSPGLVFNNSLTAINSILTGTTISANPNFTGAAALVILNEVNSTQPTSLSGPMEIAGHSASLIIANPNGITANGASTINTSRLTLTTGTPFIDPSNKLHLHVTQGQLTIASNGLNTNGADTTELIAEKIQLNGPIHAGNGDLTIQGGQHTYHWHDQATTTGSGTGTGYAIDGTALGAAQAGSIKVVATQSGVGVRIPGNLAATTGDITLDAHGNIIIGQAKAKRDLKATSSASTLTTKGTIQADRDVTLISKQNLKIEGAVSAKRHVGLGTEANADLENVIHAEGRAEVYVGNLKITPNAGIWTSQEISIETPGSIDQAGTLSSDSWISILSGNSYQLGGLTRASSDILVQSSSLHLSPNAQIDSGSFLTVETSGPINLGYLATLQAENSILLSTPQDITNRGIIKASDSVLLQTLSTIDNQGAYITADAIQLDAGQLLNNSNYGTIEAGTIGLQINAPSMLNIAGYIISGNLINLQLGAGGLNNSNGVIWAQETGDLLITTPGTLINHYGYLFADRDLDLWANQKIDNLVGTIQAGRHAWINTARLENRRGPVVRIKGGNDRDFDDIETTDLAILSADGDLTITLESAPGLKDGSLLNDASILGAGGHLTITGASLVNNAHTLLHERWKRVKKSGISGWFGGRRWVLDRRWTTGTASTGQAGGTINIQLTDSFHNTGNWIGQSFILSAPTVVNGITDYFTPTPAPTVPRRQASFGMDSLPTPSNALFQTSRDPNSLYVVSSVVPYNTDLELTPSYLSERIGISGDPSTVRFFADPLYEAYLLQRQAMADLGQRFYFDDVSTMREQRHHLYENALSLHQSFPDLKLGDLLTETHLASLTEPVIWYVYQDVLDYQAAVADYERRLAEWQRLFGNQFAATSSKHHSTHTSSSSRLGRPEPPVHIIPENRVLVPTIYLPTPLEQYANIYGGRIQAEEATIRARDRFHNTGFVNIQNDLTIAAGQIKNERRVAQAVATVTINDFIGSRTRNVFYDQIQEGGEISAGGNLTLLAGDPGITNIGGLIIGGQRVRLETTGSIHNDAQRGEFIVNWDRGELGALFGMKSWDRGVLFIHGQIVSGDDLLILAGDTVTNRGSTIEALGDVVIRAPRLIEQDIHAATYTKYQGASFNGLGFDFSTQKEIVTARSSIISHFGDVTLISDEGDIRNVGSSLLAAYDLTLFAGQNLILDARTIEAIEGLGQFIFNGTGVELAKSEWNKPKTEISLVAAGNNLILQSGNDIISKGTLIRSGNDMWIVANNDIYFDQHTVNRWVKSNGMSLGLEFFGSGLINALFTQSDLRQAAIDLFPLSQPIQKLIASKDWQDYLYNGAQLGMATWNMMEGIGSVIESGGGLTNVGLHSVGLADAKGNLQISVRLNYDQWRQRDDWTESYRNTLISGGSLYLKSGNDTHMKGGTQIMAIKDIYLDSGRSISLEAGNDKYTTKKSSFGATVGVTVGQGGYGVTLGGRASGAVSDGTIYHQARILAKGDVNIKANQDFIIHGGNITGNDIELKVGRNLHIESLQDRHEESTWHASGEVTSGMGFSFKAAGGYSDGDKAWAKQVSGIQSENRLKIDVGNSTNLIGAFIDSNSSNVTLFTPWLSFRDIANYDEYNGLNLSIGINPDKAISGSLGLSYYDRDRTGIIRATIGKGDIVTGSSLAGLNRSICNLEEITLDEDTKIKFLMPVIYDDKKLGEEARRVFPATYATISTLQSAAAMLALSPLTLLEQTALKKGDLMWGLASTYATISRGPLEFTEYYRTAQKAYDISPGYVFILGLQQIPTIGNFIPGRQATFNSELPLRFTWSGGINDDLKQDRDKKTQKAFGYENFYGNPYMRGTATEVGSSMLLGNTAPGMNYLRQLLTDKEAYSENKYGGILANAHSGGVMRTSHASRFLAYHDIPVVGFAGSQGPAIGYYNNIYNHKFFLSFAPNKAEVTSMLATMLLPFYFTNSGYANPPEVSFFSPHGKHIQPSPQNPSEWLDEMKNFNSQFKF